MTTEYDNKRLQQEAKTAAQFAATQLQAGPTPVVRNVRWTLLVGGRDTHLRVTYTILGDGDLLHTTSVAI